MKPQIVELMLESGRLKTRKDAERAYDAITFAINAWSRAWTKALPKGMHARFLMKDALSINLCWVSGEGRYADYPRFWVSLNQRSRKQYRCMKDKEYERFKSMSNVGHTEQEEN